MAAEQKLVTWGSCRYVRHISYLAYFLLILCLALIWLTILTLPCFIALSGCYLGLKKKKKILIEKFGNEYRTYQEQTGRL